MHHKSIATFAEEMASVGNIPGLLWSDPAEFPRQDDPFRSFRLHELDQPGRIIKPEQSVNPDMDFIDETDHIRLTGQKALKNVLQYRFKSEPEGFVERFYDATGVDLDEMRSSIKKDREVLSQNRANLVMRFGMEAYGTYLPWHAFARSSTPWGIYILPERIAEWADDLLRTSKGLPSPLPSWEQMFFILLWVTYRHELFHWHVETFALRHEVLVRQPVYRPYVEHVPRSNQKKPTQRVVGGGAGAGSSPQKSINSRKVEHWNARAAQVFGAGFQNPLW